jgi:hypothetical protein
MSKARMVLAFAAWAVLRIEKLGLWIVQTSPALADPLPLILFIRFGDGESRPLSTGA